MLIIPAIDLLGGRVVRLLRGDYAQQTTYKRDPVQTAQWFVDQGATRLHVVDLDAARGRPDERSAAAMAAIVRALAERGTEVEVAGGVRNADVARSWIACGASHVGLGSLAVRDPASAEAICVELPGRVLLALDVRGGQAQAQGWTEAGGEANLHVQRWRNWPAAGIIHTLVERDGAMVGVDVPAISAVMNAYGDRPVYASGGVARIEDLDGCAAAGLAGVIVGRALYEGSVNLADAVTRFGTAASA